MHSLNLKNLLLTGSAIILTFFIMAFPTYLFVEVFQNKSATAFLFVIFALSSSIYGYASRQDNFISTILKLSLFTATYLLMLATLINYENVLLISSRWLLLVSALYFASMPLFFHNPYLRILTLTSALIVLNIDLYIHPTFFGFNGTFMISLVILVILGLSNYAMRCYTFVIALALHLLSWPLWEAFTYRGVDLSLTTPTIVYFLLGLSFIPYLITHWKHQSQQLNLFYLIGIVGLLILAYFLPNSTIAGILIIALGFYLQSRALNVIGLLLFSVSLFMYYYQLNTTLSTKGIILIATGSSILLARYAYHYFSRAHYEN